MTDKTKPSKEETESLWQIVPLSDHTLPLGHSAAHTWLSFNQLFKNGSASEALFDDELKLKALPPTRRADLVPPLLWGDGAKALNTELQGWLTQNSTDNHAQFLVGQPFFGQAQIVSQLGSMHHANEILPPSVEQILANDSSWLANWPDVKSLWVLPNLEHCFLRHTTGLDLVRDFLSKVLSGQLGRGVIGCDSWAWAYLQRVLPLPDAAALTVQAFDAKRLHQLLFERIKPELNKELHFYDATNGKEINRANDAQEHLQTYLIKLAAYSRGNPAIATKCWRERLHSREQQSESVSDGAKNVRLIKDATGEYIWVAGMPLEPELPLGDREEYLLILHAILLQGGLPELLLEQLLSISVTRCRGLLDQLQQARITVVSNGRWQIQEMAYLSVRKLLCAHDYLVDSF